MAKAYDPAFQGAGHKIGTEIWRIEASKPVPLSKDDYGKFYSGDSYIVLKTNPSRCGSHHHDVHYWIGKDTNPDEFETVMFKAVELDAALGGRAVLHREIQGYESERFLSCFRPCIIPLEGGHATGSKTAEDEHYQTHLYICRGKRTARIKEVPFSRSSLNHDDVFILDTENKVFQFNGANSNIQERATALEVIQFIKEKFHGGNCEMAIVEDGKLKAESDSGEFWVLFGGFAPIGKKGIHEDDAVPKSTAPKLYSILSGETQGDENELNKSVLENHQCYLLECGSEVHVWVGRATQVDERKSAAKAAEQYLNNQNRPKATKVVQVIQGHETRAFKSHFESWPVGPTGNSGGEEGLGKVAAMLKQKGVEAKGISKNHPVNDEVPPLLESNGKLEVWYVNDGAKCPIEKDDIGKFHCGDCYIILYAYHSGEKKEEYYLTTWTGKNSVLDDQMAAAQLSNAMWNSLKGKPVQGHIYQGKEPPQFVSLFQPMVILKGGISSGYKKFVSENEQNDDTYMPDSIALFRVSGTAPHNRRAFQVDAVATSLSSTDCFVLQSGNQAFTWLGTSSFFELQQWAGKVAEFLKPGATVKHSKEGAESSAFWFALGGKQSYTTKDDSQEPPAREPHLYSFSINSEKLEVFEIYNFCQDDLLTEDMLILDTLGEVFIWMGQCVDAVEKQNAFDIGQKYLEHEMSYEGLPIDRPLYRVTEAYEPCFFKTYFLWDNAKSLAHGNSFEKKLSHLYGIHDAESKHSSNAGHTQRAEAMAALSSAFNASSQAKQSSDRLRVSVDGPTQRASALAALSTAFNPESKPKATTPPARVGQGSQRAAAVAALSAVLTAEQTAAKQSSSPTADGAKPGASVEEGEAEVPSDDAAAEGGDEQESSEHQEEHDTVVTEFFSHERLKVHSADPVEGINYKRREAYLEESEFEMLFQMSKEQFYELPRWKQEAQKKKLDLF